MLALWTVVRALERAEVAAHYYFVRAELTDTDEVDLQYVLAVDWFQASGRLRVPSAVTDSEATALVQSYLCLDFQNPLVSYESAISALAECSQAGPSPCSNRLLPDCGLSVAGYAYRTRRADVCDEFYLMLTYVDAKTATPQTCEMGPSLGRNCP
jgi:hypothetical protein